MDVAAQAGNTAASPHAPATRPARIPPTIDPRANAVLENRACAVARSDAGARRAMNVVVPTRNSPNPTPPSAAPATRPIALPVIVNSSALTTKIAAPATSSHWTRKRPTSRRYASIVGISRTAFAAQPIPTSRASPPSSMSRRLKNAMIPAAATHTTTDPAKNRPEARVAEQAERADRPDARRRAWRASPPRTAAPTMPVSASAGTYTASIASVEVAWTSRPTASVAG